MYLYKADLSAYLNQKMTIQVVDNATSDWGFSMLDSFITYYEDEASLPQNAELGIDIKPTTTECNLTAPSVYEIINSGFENGDLCGWTAEGEAFTDTGVTTDSISWGGVTTAPDGTHLFSTWAQGGEETTGSLTSSNFTLGGTGMMSFRLGGGPDTNLIYISIYKADGTEIARYGNSAIVSGQEPVLIQYQADLSSYIGEELYIKVVDNAINNWGIVTMDSFSTYYTDVNNLPLNAIQAVNLLV